MIYKKIKNKFNTYKINKHVRYFFKNIKLKKANGKKVLIYAGIGDMYISYFEILLYNILKKEGYDVEYLIYNKDIPINEIITKEVIDNIGKDKFWNNSVNNSIKLLKRARVNYEFISIDKINIEKDLRNLKALSDVLSFKKDEINLGEIVEGNMYRYYKSLTFGDDAFEISKKMLYTALVNFYQIKEKTDKNEYQYVMFSHGIYVTWEPVSEFCKSSSIDFIAYDRAKTKNTINVNYNQVAPDWSFDIAWERYRNIDLKENEIEKVRLYLKDRELQKNDVYAYNYSKRSKDLIELKKHLTIPLNVKVVTIFTNLIWDAANVSRDLAFKNPLECLIQTIDFFKNDKDVHILLRSHPAESILGTQEKYGTLIRDHFENNLPNNVTIIEPELSINSFSVIDVSDIGIVNTSTVGLEFAMLNKPVILISETHYRNKGFTYDVRSRNEYFDTLKDLLNDPKKLPRQVELAEKYFYIMMFKYQQELPMKYNDVNFSNYTYTSIEDVPRVNNIYKIIENIKLNKTIDFVD